MELWQKWLCFALEPDGILMFKDISLLHEVGKYMNSYRHVNNSSVVISIIREYAFFLSNTTHDAFVYQPC